MSAFLPALRPALPIRWSTANSRGWVIGSLIALPGAVAACGFLLAGGPPSVSAIRLLPHEGAGSGVALRTVGLRGQRAGGFLTVTGTAENVSDRDLRDVEAVVEWFGDDAKLRLVDSALLEFASVRPGGESPFRVLARDEDGVTAFRVRFRSLGGALIPSRDENQR